jgi:tetratricopeptide (TPR) repeat protein
MGWDKQANRYDLHPIVRGVVWTTLASEAKHGLYSELHSYFDAAPRPPNYLEVEKLEDLTPAIELFDKLIGLERYADAIVVFRDHLEDATLFRLSASRLRAELLERLFPDGLEAPPRLAESKWQTFALNGLAQAFEFGGEPGRAQVLFLRAAEIDEQQTFTSGLRIKTGNLARVLSITGKLRDSERSSRRTLGISRELVEGLDEAEGLWVLGEALALRGDFDQSEIALRRSLAIAVKEGHQQGQGLVFGSLARSQVWASHGKSATTLADRAWALAHVERAERDIIHAARLQGEASLELGDLVTAAERFHHALTRARAVDFVGEELPALIALAELHRQRREYDPARELLEQVWAPAERGPYPLLHSDARNVLARTERDEGHRIAAIAAARRAYETAWCDGPPYAYHYGLTNAKKLLAELGAPQPQLPPFDESKFEPMPEVEINPKDEFWIDPATLDSNT